MTKNDLTERIHTSTNLSKKDSGEILEAIFSLIKDTLSSGEKIKITGFGSFEVYQKNARKGRNPQTGETINLEARRVLTFKTSSVLKSAINNQF
jgi:integration host factor subunit alpha